MSGMQRQLSSIYRPHVTGIGSHCNPMVFKIGLLVRCRYMLDAALPGRHGTYSEKEGTQRDRLLRLPVARVSAEF